MSKGFEKISDIFWLIVYSAVISLFVFAFAKDAWNCTTERLLTNIAFFLLLSSSLCICRWLDCGNRLFVLVITFITFVPNIIVLAWLIMDHYVMKSTDFWVVFDTNPAEAAGFFDGVPPKVYIWSTVYTLLCILLSLKIMFKHKKRSWAIQLIIMSVLAGILCLQPFRTLIMSVDFYKSFYKYNKEKYQVAQFYKSRENLTVDAQDIIPDENKTFVFIIGESQNREHMSLYGYPRDTNPKLQSLADNLIVYSDVVSPFIQTLPCMKSILTFTNYEQPQMFMKEASMVEIFRDAGYETFWIDNQGSNRGLWAIDFYTPTSYRNIAHMCSIYEDYGQLDSIVVSRFKKYLNNPAKKKIFFLHLVGNHFNYASRYESSFQRFSDEPVCSKVEAELTKKDIDIINHYDNATLYNDHIVFSIIDELRNLDGIAGLIYISDHGEEVFDTEYTYTRSFERILPAMCDIPFVVWRNEEHRKVIPLTIETSRPYCTDDIIYSWMDFAGIRYHLYDSKRSIFSADFQNKTRMVQGQTYESILSQNK